MAEATRLAGLSPGEWKIWIDGSAERLEIARDKLEAVVLEILKDREKKTREAKSETRRSEQRAERSRREERQQDRQQEREQEREQRRIEKEAERQQERERRRIEKEVERKSKEKAKAFGNLQKLPVARHEKELQRLAARLGEDVTMLRQEFDEFIGVEGGDASSVEQTEPWPEPVEAAAVLDECAAKTCKYVVIQPHPLTAAVLWAAHAWLYDHGVPIHSPILAATSSDPDTGKSTLTAVVGRAAPRLSINVEMTGPSLFRFVDAIKPTLVLDEADDIFARRTDLKHIINAGWTRGAKIPRQVKIDDFWQTVWFDPFTPKAMALLDRNLPAATRTRCIELRMHPKLPNEEVEPFSQLDDAEFAVLRRKFARFGIDNAATLKEAKPVMPAGLNNRVAANWKLLLAIAELAGGQWPQRAREAAERLSQSRRKPSVGIQLLAAFRAAFTEIGKGKTGEIEITSEDMVARLNADPTSIWAGYNHGGPITQRQVAVILDDYDIHPVSLHPTKRKDFARQGYKLSQFTNVFARYLPRDPIIQSPGKKQRVKGRKTAVIR
jgi:putative DNA primase/helicase